MFFPRIFDEFVKIAFIIYNNKIIIYYYQKYQNHVRF
jgi:hypothetical protein